MIDHRTVRVPIQHLRRATLRALRARSFSDVEARTIATFAVDATAEGYVEHGIGALYVLEQLGDLLPGRGEILTTRRGSRALHTRATGHLGYLPALQAVQGLVRLTRRGALPAFATVSSRGFRGRLAHLVRPIAEAGAAAIAMQGTPHVVPAAVRHPPAVGTNPIALGIPGTDRSPIIADIGSAGPSFLREYFGSVSGRVTIPKGFRGGPLRPAADRARLVLAIGIQTLTASAVAPDESEWPLVLVALPCEEIPSDDRAARAWARSLGLSRLPGPNARMIQRENQRRGVPLPAALWEWLNGGSSRTDRARA